MLNIHIVHYVMSLYNIKELKFNDAVSINKQLNKLKRHKKENKHEIN